MLRTSDSPSGYVRPDVAVFGVGEMGTLPGMKRTFYALIGWVAWKYGKRTMRRKLRFVR
jgi:hypothetical protein